jgi:hypothetical protein
LHLGLVHSALLGGALVGRVKLGKLINLRVSSHGKISSACVGCRDITTRRAGSMHVIPFARGDHGFSDEDSFSHPVNSQLSATGAFGVGQDGQYHVKGDLHLIGGLETRIVHQVCNVLAQFIGFAHRRFLFRQNARCRRARSSASS